MKKWDIWMYGIPSEDDPHPFVIISSSKECQKKKILNALECVSLRGGMKVESHHVVLDDQDGLDNRTIVDCSFVYMVNKDKLFRRRGEVGAARRNKIAKTRYDYLMDA